MSAETIRDDERREESRIASEAARRKTAQKYTKPQTGESFENWKSEKEEWISEKQSTEAMTAEVEQMMELLSELHIEHRQSHQEEIESLERELKRIERDRQNLKAENEELREHLQRLLDVSPTYEVNPPSPERFYRFTALIVAMSTGLIIVAGWGSFEDLISPLVAIPVIIIFVSLILFASLMSYQINNGEQAGSI